jgi:hypothetical protein
MKHLLFVLHVLHKTTKPNILARLIKAKNSFVQEFGRV